MNIVEVKLSFYNRVALATPNFLVKVLSTLYQSTLFCNKDFGCIFLTIIGKIDIFNGRF